MDEVSASSFPSLRFRKENKRLEIFFGLLKAAVFVFVGVIVVVASVVVDAFVVVVVVAVVAVAASVVLQLLLLLRF